jgi:hypothetical protein
MVDAQAAPFGMPRRIMLSVLCLLDITTKVVSSSGACSTLSGAALRVDLMRCSFATPSRSGAAPQGAASANTCHYLATS